MDENIEIFTHLWEHAENEVVEFNPSLTDKIIFHTFSGYFM